MFQMLKRYTFALITLVLYCHEATADEALMDGVRPFICDGESIVFLESNDGWVISTIPTAEVKRSNNGWRVEDILNGDVWYLREEGPSSWVIDGLSEDGHFSRDCIDVFNSISQVFPSIKPRLDEGILDIETQLAATTEELRLTHLDYSLEIQRVERLCIWMKTYQHLEVLDTPFSFNDEKYKLCN